MCSLSSSVEQAIDDDFSWPRSCFAYALWMSAPASLGPEACCFWLISMTSVYFIYFLDLISSCHLLLTTDFWKSKKIAFETSGCVQTWPLGRCCSFRPRLVHAVYLVFNWHHNLRWHYCLVANWPYYQCYWNWSQTGCRPSAFDEGVQSGTDEHFYQAAELELIIIVFHLLSELEPLLPISEGGLNNKNNY